MYTRAHIHLLIFVGLLCAANRIITFPERYQKMVKRNGKFVI